MYTGENYLTFAKEKRKKITEQGEKEVKNKLKNFTCDTHLKCTKGKRIQLKNLGGGEEII